MSGGAMLRCLIALFSAWYGVVAAGREPNASPNFVVLFADDMGYGDLSVNGHPTIRTPNIDQLAHGGIRFSQWYSAFHVCSPSRAAMLTGRLPIRSGTTGAGWTGGVFGASAVGGLPHNETTFAEALKTAGYATGMVGKWHLGQKPEFLPTNNGFDEYFGLPYSDDMGSSAWSHYDRGDRPPLPLLHNTTIIEQPTDLGTLTQRYAQYASDYINRKKDEKFVLYMAFSHVHTPNFVSKEFCNTSARGKFGDAAAEMDNAVGVIMKALDDAGVRNNTLTFFTSDNGPWLIQKLEGGSAGPFYEGKTTTWEGGIREPGIANWPGTIAPGRIAQQVVATYDIFPTMMKLAGVPPPKDRIIDGKDMSPIFSDPTVASQHDCIYIYKGTPNGDAQPGLWAVRCGSYKAHFVTNNHINTTAVMHDPPLLYHVERDATEVYALDPKSTEYLSNMATIMAARQAHLASLKHVPNQMAMGEDPKQKLCCDWDSKKKYPKYQECTCNPDNWEAWTCGRPILQALTTPNLQ
ncbi:steryl-sulfatase-like [Sycon ciliatum]|uniref:steryl-sulfatase-like n=1 Tax=Sycon ciliatum TaxID=27933 RepID=UPI0031F67CE3